MSTTIRPCRVADIEQAPNIDALVSAYVEEAGVPEMGPGNPQWGQYHELEAAGVLHCFAAWDDETLVGMCFVLISSVPHFGIPFASLETFFVAKTHRAGGAGLRLLRAAEDLARSHGLKHVMATAPAESALSVVLPRRGYRESNRVYLRVLGDE
ncbi:MAG: GNAT family N-acetyltransferase [Xanthomonadales bacterium]|nr:GNAT family N-acetyltransferase [Xanthomonadales bacterium]